MSYINIIRKDKTDLAKFLDSHEAEYVNAAVPENLSKKLLLRIKPAVGFTNDEKWLGRVYYIINSIISRSANKEIIDIVEGRETVALSTELLLKVCGSNYNVILKTLLKNKIIESDGKYSILKHQSRKYKLADIYAGKPLKFRPIKDPMVLKALNAHRKELLKQLRTLTYLTRWITTEGLELDVAGATTFLDEYRDLMTDKLMYKKLVPKLKGNFSAYIDSRCNSALFTIENWHTIRVRMSTDDKGGRFYNGLTSMMGPLRNFLTYKGKQLVSLDIKNSQPFHSILVFRESFYEPENPLGLNKLLHELYKHLVHTRQIYTILMLIKGPKPLRRRLVQPVNFESLVRSGKLYEYITALFTGKYHTSHNIDRFSTRNKTKLELLRMFYYNPQEQYSPSKAPFKAFGDVFRSEAGIITALKSRHYTDFSVLLQKLEAQILLHMVCKQIFERNPAIPIFSIHDSITTTVEHQAVVHEIINDVYTSAFGFEPQVEITMMSPKTAYDDLPAYTNRKIQDAVVKLTRKTVATTKVSVSHVIKEIDAHFNPAENIVIPEDYDLTSIFNMHIQTNQADASSLSRRRLRDKKTM